MPRLAELYAYPRERWLRANMVSSADGAGFLDGRSEGLSSEDDRRLFRVLRVLADVILVGAGTARTEGYKPARRREALAALRAGRAPTAADRPGEPDAQPEPGLAAVHRRRRRTRGRS